MRLRRSMPWRSCRHRTSGSPSLRALAIARAADNPAESVVRHGIPCATAARRISQPSVRAPTPVGVLTTRSTSPRSIQSSTCGRAFLDLVEPLNGHSHPFDRLRRAAGCDDLKAAVVQQLGDPERTGLVGVGDGDERGAVRRQRHARRRLRLGERRREVACYAHDLAGGAHLGPEDRVRTVETVERQHGLLDGHVVSEADAFTTAREIEVRYVLAEHQSAGELRER